MNPLARLASWLAEKWRCSPAGNAWTGRLKPCDCPRSERYWGLGGHPPDATQVDDGARRVETETEAATVVEWKATRTWRCRNCGECWQQHLPVVVERDVQWHEDTSEACPEVTA